MTTKINKNSAIGKPISKIPNRHKDYFEVDENNVVTGYKRKVCIDTMFLKARLSAEECYSIIESFDFENKNRYNNGDRCFKHEKTMPNGFKLITYRIKLTESYGVYIKLQPYLTDSINAEIQLHSKFTTNLNGNLSLFIDILNNHNWYVQRLDVAIDYVTLFSTSAYLTHGNRKIRNYETSSNAGSSSSPTKRALNSSYDRAKKDNTLDTKFTNRFEVKLFFNEADNMRLGNINHDLIVERLKKENFIPCLAYSKFHEQEIETKKGVKSTIKLIQKAKEQDKLDSDGKVKRKKHLIMSLVTKSTWDTFRKHFMASRDDIEQAYLNNKDTLYGFIKVL